MLVLVLVFCCELCVVEPNSFGKPQTCSVHVFHVQCLELVCLFQFLLIFAFVLLFFCELEARS